MAHAHTNAKIIKETTLLLCNIAVMVKPENSAFKFVSVLVRIRLLSLCAAVWLIVFSRTCTANKNRDNHPNIKKTCDQDMEERIKENKACIVI